MKIRPAAVLDVKTEPATGVTRTTALLNGSLDPDGIETTYWFEYGIDTNYRQRTAETSAGSGSGSVSADPTEIANLQPGRRYHFRLAAEQLDGDDHGPGPDVRRSVPPHDLGGASVGCGRNGGNAAVPASTPWASRRPTGSNTGRRRATAR